MSKKKLTDEEFLKLIIDKELIIAGASITYDDIKEDSSKPYNERKYPNWFSDNKFKTYEQFMEWKNFFMDHFYDWKPKYYGKRMREDNFSWINLMYGLAYGFEFPKNNNDK